MKSFERNNWWLLNMGVYGKLTHCMNMLLRPHGNSLAMHWLYIYLSTLTLGLFELRHLRWPFGLFCNSHGGREWILVAEASALAVCRVLLPWTGFFCSPPLCFLYFGQSSLPSLHMALQPSCNSFLLPFYHGLSLMKAWAYYVWLWNPFIVGFLCLVFLLFCWWQSDSMLVDFFAAIA